MHKVGWSWIHTYQVHMNTNTMDIKKLRVTINKKSSGKLL